jgi:transcription elongation factor SPT6
VSKQDGRTPEDCLEWERKYGGGGSSVREQIKVALDFIRQQFLEVPFIAFYRKEYVPSLKIDDLWRVYEFDEQWCKLEGRKKNLKELMNRMQTYQMVSIFLIVIVYI